MNSQMGSFKFEQFVKPQAESAWREFLGEPMVLAGLATILFAVTALTLLLWM